VLTEQDIYFFKEGTYFGSYEKLGAHPVAAQAGNAQGTHFALWAPNARSVAVVGDFNGWDGAAHPLSVRADSSGIWSGFIVGVQPGAIYKYRIISQQGSYCVDKSDPFAFYCERPPRTASIVWNLDYEWGDSEWLKRRPQKNALQAPWSIYEVHLGSWRRVPEENGRSLSYRQMAQQLGDYAVDMGFTHVELLPIMEHPFYGSWGYQVTGYFAATARYGTPQDLMYLIDSLHQRGLGVILDWVPSHFPNDEHGLAYFDGTHLYEHADPRQGFHPEWKSAIFNYGRSEVRNFLASSALFWLKIFHADALRVDGVASMLYLDYARKSGEWIPNTFGGRENLDAVSFVKKLNEAVYRDHTAVHTIAEESTAWPMVSRPTYLGGLGFGLKWNLGWMHDTLDYFATDPVYRKYYHGQLTFSLLYAFNENFVLPLSHDEVVHGKGSLLGRMAGDEWQQFANLRLLFGYMWGHPGKKLLFMGGEFGQRSEWHHDASLDWHVLQYPLHAGLQRWVRELNHLYSSTPALHAFDFSWDGFEWIDCNDSESSVITFLRKSGSGEMVLVVCNFTPVVRTDYRVGVPRGGYWRELLNSDAAEYGGSGVGNFGGVEAAPLPAHGRFHSLALRLPPLGVLFLSPD
jgi:1,4-alpha-glucan branching enzyme